MEEFNLEDCVKENLAKNPQRVSHALNLVLRLKYPREMPELLLKIQAAQPNIRRALSELNFVHFARFVPTRDNTALQVITEFDGPLEPYVMDFAIALVRGVNQVITSGQLTLLSSRDGGTLKVSDSSG